jgi:hypothetical protein
MISIVTRVFLYKTPRGRHGRVSTQRTCVCSMHSLVVLPQSVLGEDDVAVVPEEDVFLFWSCASADASMLSNFFGLTHSICGGYKSVEHAMQKTKMRAAAWPLFREDGALGSFAALRAHPSCDVVVGILFPRSKKVIDGGRDPFRVANGIGFWFAKGMDGVLAKMAVKEAVCVRLRAAAHAGKIDPCFKECVLDEHQSREHARSTSARAMRDPSTWHRALQHKFARNKLARAVLVATKYKRLVEFVRGKDAATHPWGGKLVAASFRGRPCKKLVGCNTMGLYIERVRAELL